VYDREREIDAFAESLSWKIQCHTDHGPNLIWTSTTHTDEKEATEILTRLNPLVPFTIIHRADRVSTSAPPAPFITSTLQQEASNRLSMNPKITMKVAQKLYELGHITYMRTDNPEMSSEAVEQASEYVTARWGAEFVFDGTEDKGVKGKKDKQKEKEKEGAHEAIRPTHFDFLGLESGSEQEQENKLYRLIWKRSIQSVMAHETRDVIKLTGVLDPVSASASEAEEEPRKYETSCNRVTFQGFRILDEKEENEKEDIFQTVSELSVGRTLQWEKVTATEVRTSPPSMYTEASLIHLLEKKGIGRPSTYASLIETVLDRGYVEKITIKPTSVKIKGLERTRTQTQSQNHPTVTSRTENVGGEKGKLHTTPLGITVIRWLLDTFGDMIEYDYTAHLETQLDLVSKGDLDYSVVLDTAWKQIECRYKKIMDTPSTASASSVFSKKSNDLGEGYKCIESKKGLLFVHESELPTRFAEVPDGITVQTAVLQDAKDAFDKSSSSSNSNTLGNLDGDPIIRKSGKFGPYVTWKGRTVSCKDDDTLETLTPKLQALVDSVDHCVGPYKIKSGPYGLYMFKPGPGPGSKGKPKFVNIPSDTSYETLTVEGADALYTHCSKEKGKGKGKGKRLLSG
jgi:DNA topoisomerase-1